MSLSIASRRVPGLMLGCTLLLSLFLFSGCTFLKKFFHEDKVENDSNRPSMVLLANDVTEDGTIVHIEIDKIMIGNVAFSDIIAKADAWRVNLYAWDGNSPVGPYAEYISTKERTLKLQIPKDKIDKFLRADLDLKLKETMDGAAAKEAKEVTRSFGILVHKYPD